MIGRLECNSPDRRVLELPTEPVSVGGGAGDVLNIPGLPPELARFSWDSGLATWRVALGAGGSEGVVNGVSMAETRRPALLDGYRIRIGNFSAVFRKELAAPRFMGEDVEEITLGKSTIVLGRGPAGTNDGEEKVELDTQDNRVSKRHAVLTYENGDHFLTDEGRFLATELNFRAFERERLVYGDRIKVGDYVFEYTGRTIRRVDQVRTGEILAHSIRVVVHKPSTRAILKDINLAIKPGEFVGVLGGSGQGKSTLLNALCGINPATSGEVYINGIPLTDRKKMRELGIGYVPQDDIVHRELNVEQAVTYSAKLRLKLSAGEISTLVDGVIRRMGLEPHRHKRISKLSGGQRKRVSIAIELLAKPTILFLDEPSSGLDPATEEKLMSLLQQLAKTGLTVVCTTHILQLAHMLDRLLFVHGGKLVFSGTADEARRLFLDGGSITSASQTGQSNPSRSGVGLAPLQRVYGMLDSEAAGKPDDAIGEEWERRFLESDVSLGHVEAIRQAEQNRDSGQVPPPQNRQGKVGYLRTLYLLIARQAKILLADPLNILFLVAQALMIGVLIGWVTDDISLRLFLGMIATMWFGCSNGAQQIVSELPIFRRERVCGQGINVYLHSKVFFLSLITMVQSLALLLTIQITAVLLHPPLTSHSKLWDEIVAARYPIPEYDFRVRGDKEAHENDVAAAKDEGRPAPAMPQELVDELAKEDQRMKVAEAARPSNLWIGTLTNIAWLFDLRNNILDSSPTSEQTGDAESRSRKESLPVLNVLVNSLGLKLLSLVLASLVGVMLGLTISAVVQSSTQAAMWVPLILIPQILFGGYVVHISEMTSNVRAFSRFLPSYASQQVMDVGTLYGQWTPKMTNRTKIPVFIDNIEAGQEVMKWIEDKQEKTQEYDRKSLFNSAWQNLAVAHERAGKRKVYVDEAGDKPQSADLRDDVLYRHENPEGAIPHPLNFISLAPVYQNVQILTGWVALCYILIVSFLAAKQTGK